MRRLLYLFAGCAAFWLLTALPARWLGGGDAAVACAGSAMLLCLVPAALTLAWASWALKQDGQQQLLVVVGGAGVRMFFALTAGLVLTQVVTFFQEQAVPFLLWLGAAYLFTLALEVGLILSGRPAPSGAQSK